MKKLAVIFVAIFSLGSSLLYSQTGWFQQNSGTAQELDCVYFINELTGFAGGGFRIFKTTNGGTSWNQTILPDTTTLTAIRFLNNTTGYACGGRSNQNYCLQHLFKTTNTGATWFKICQMSSSFTFFDLFRDVFPIDTLLYLTNGGSDNMGSTGGMYLSQNGGINFSMLNISYGEFINQLSFVNPQTGWVSTQYRTDVSYSKCKIFKTTNSGQNWAMQFRDSIANIYITSNIDIQFLNQNTGYGLYKRESSVNTARFLKTSNGGSTWDSTNLPYQIYGGMFFADANTGWISGGYYPDSIIIIRTTNSGSNWHVQKKGTYSLSAFYFVNNFTGWAVGYNGVILKTVTGGVTGVQNISTEVPIKYSLDQNYPNPFNPSTNVKFSIVKSGDVKVVVYDVMGREVQTLVNQRLNAGMYEVEFDGSMLTSGMYFYKIVSGGYSETKRMVLIK